MKVEISCTGEIFQFQTTHETKHPTLGHIHHTEYDLILEIETGEDKGSEKEIDALNTTFTSETATSNSMSQAVHHSVTSSVKIQFLDKLNRNAIPSVGQGRSSFTGHFVKLDFLL